MRPAKFLFALIFGVVFLITLLKVLFFILFAASVVGGLWLLSRLFFRRHYHHYAAGNYAAAPWQSQPLDQRYGPYAEPLDPNWQRGYAPATPLGKRIEVL